MQDKYFKLPLFRTFVKLFNKELLAKSVKLHKVNSCSVCCIRYNHQMRERFIMGLNNFRITFAEKRTDMKRQLIILLALLIPVLYSCEEAEEIIENIGLSDSEIIAGLKESLQVGTDTAVSIVSQVDGYYKDELIKILLPPEADIIVNNLNNPLLQGIGLDQLVEDIVFKINRAAEDAAKDAGPIFWDAITGMTITDGYNILHGEDTAATHYLRENTFDQLFQLYAPKMQNSLDKDIVAGVSAQDAWDSMIGQYNTIANSLVGQAAGLQAVNTNLGDYVTRKGLNGLFVKVADEEKAIRHDPLARVTALLQRVFGSLDG
jgi:hypothetical protein